MDRSVRLVSDSSFGGYDTAGVARLELAALIDLDRNAAETSPTGEILAAVPEMVYNAGKIVDSPPAHERGTQYDAPFVYDGSNEGYFSSSHSMSDLRYLRRMRGFLDDDAPDALEAGELSPFTLDCAPPSMSIHLGPFPAKDVGSTVPRPRTAPPASWARYPSHTRHQRTGSATADDDVLVRDFAVHDESRRGLANAFAAGDRGQHLGTLKSRGMVYGKSVLSRIHRLYRSQSTDYRIPGAGHRSSLATGGALEYPELEVLPNRTPPAPSWLPPPALRRQETLEMKELETAGRASKRPEGHPPLVSKETPRHAPPWAERYRRDCVLSPGDGGGVVGRGGE
ncbi:MAG: hypothetical protein M1826_000866 [Phylliscum demangeonii]|nr:MAG: hypothetical protein M1826_000866 [Phylliscum demangeonii]